MHPSALSLPPTTRAMQVLAYGVEGMRLRNVLQELDVRKAKATVESDRERILQAIEADLG